jgi:hypothetical protein
MEVRTFMNSSKAKIIGATLLTVCASALAACGKASKGYAGDLDFTKDTRNTTISFWTGFGSAITTKLEDLVLADFSEKYKINVEHEGKGGYEGLQKAINLSASQVTYPNIAVGYPDHFASYINSDILLQLDDFIEGDKNIPATREDGFKEADKINMDDFYSYYMAENRSLEYKDDGTPYTVGLPFNKSTELMVFNKTFFDNEKVEEAGIFVPSTWDDIETVGERIINFVKPSFGKVLGADGVAYASEKAATDAGTRMLMNLTEATAENFYPFSWDSAANLFITGVRQWGGTYTEVDKDTRKGYIAFDSEQTRSYLRFVQNLAKKHILAIPISFEGTSLYCSSFYTNFQSVMNVGSSAGLTNYSTSVFSRAKGFESGIAHIPFRDDEHKFVISQGTNLCILDKGSEEERIASWKAVKYLATEGNALFASETGYYPVCKAAAESPLYQEFLHMEKDPETGKALDDNTYNKQNGAKYNSAVYDAENSGWTKFVDPGFPGSSTIREAIGNLISEILVDQADIDGTIAKYKTELRDYVR